MNFLALGFNPYWGYDGGGHLDYIFSLAAGHFPSMQTNYIAWHEPLYYFMMAPVWWMWNSIMGLQIMQAILAVILGYVAYKFISILTSNTYVRLAALGTWMLLAPVRLASTFITNELLNYICILLTAYIAMKAGAEEKILSTRAVIIIGVMGGVAVMTKITGIVAVGAVIIAIIAKHWSTERIRACKQGVAIFAIAAIIYAPWLAYRSTHILPSLSINNTEYLAPASLLPTKERLAFFVTFDTDIFAFPYWYSGGRGFWSMLYADTFWDYYGMLQNRDLLAALPDAQKIATNHNGGFVTRSEWNRAKYYPFLALPFAIIMIVGAIQLTKKPFSIPTVLSAGLFAALVYFAYRYPFYDRGIVKSIFIGPMYLPLLVAGYARMAEIWKQRKYPSKS